MRILYVRSLVLLVGSFLLSGCLPSRIYVEQVRTPPSRTPALERGVAVVADPDAEFSVSEYELERLAEDLRATGVFRTVRVGRGEGDEMLAITREAFEGPGCGNPLIPTMMSFGLIPVTMPRTVSYDFDLMLASAPGPLTFQHRYSTKEKFGLLAVPLRLSKKWSKSPENGTPRPFIEALRADLLARVESLTEN